MKKRIILVMLLSLIFTPVTVLAAPTVNVSISVSTSQTVVGNSGKATVTISSNEVIAQIYGMFTCGGLGEKNLYYSNGGDSTSTKKTYTIDWTAKTTGTYTCTVTGLQFGSAQSPEAGVFSSSANDKKTITVIGKTNTGSSGGTTSTPNSGTTNEKKNYSSDNSLSSITIEGYDLNPKFDKNTTAYTLEVDESVDEIKIDAKTNDSKATTKGTGTVKLSSGENKIEITAIAENGNEKKYTITVNVIDKNPINVTINKEKYTVVKKNNELIDVLSKFEETSIEISGQKVVAYKNEKSNITLVILKDSKGAYDYYQYDATKNTYTQYKQIEYNGITLACEDIPSSLIPTGYQKFDFAYNNKAFIGYKYDKSSDFYLFYAKNLDTNKYALYQYDKVSGMIQRYDTNLSSMYQEQIDKYYLYFLISLLVLAIVIIIFSTILITKGKKKQTNIPQLKQSKETVTNDSDVTPIKKEVKKELNKKTNKPSKPRTDDMAEL